MTDDEVRDSLMVPTKDSFYLDYVLDNLIAKLRFQYGLTIEKSINAIRSEININLDRKLGEINDSNS